MKGKVLRFLEEEIMLNHIPGAVVFVSHQGNVLLNESIGNRSIFPKKNPMTLETVFDVASLTKVVTTLPALLKLIDASEVQLDDKVSYYLPKFGQGGKDEITIENLLAHTSGLQAHRPFHLHYQSPTKVFESIYFERLEQPIGSKVVYSDLGFMVLSKLIEAVTRMRFSDFVHKELFEPLEMINATFHPKQVDGNYAATEYSELLGKYKEGIVHDENAELMNGESGHAGLFATVQDLKNYCSMIENNGVFRGKQLLSESILTLSRKNFSPLDSKSRGLGWELKSPFLSPELSGITDYTFGHTGFTGTSIWFEPTKDLHVILLTNRVHLGRETPIRQLRTDLHKMIWSSLD